MKCLLCDSQAIRIVESYKKQDLLKLWDFIDMRGELELDEIKLYRCSDCGLNYFDPKLAGKDNFYSQLGQLEWYYLHSGKTEYDYAQKYFYDGCNVLDIGAGRGVLFTKTKNRLNYVGLELSTKAVELAQKANINVIQEDLIVHAKNNAGKYDVICLFQVLEHLTELEQFIESVYDCLKSKGLFVIAVPDNDGFISYSTNNTFNLPPHHTILWTEKSLNFLAQKFNFKVLEIEREPLQDVHLVVATQEYWISKFCKLFFIKPKLVDNRLSYFIIRKVAGKLYSMAFFKKWMVPYIAKKIKSGQSIIITLQKD